MRLFLIWAVGGAIVFLMAAPPMFDVSQVALANDDDFAPDEVVIKLYPGSDLAAIAAEFQLNPIPLSQFGSREIYRMQIIDGESPVHRAEELQADARVEFAETNLTVKPPEWRSRYSWARFDEQTHGGTRWVPGKLRLAKAHRVSTGAGITVAVLDTGVDATHPDLAGRIIPGYDFVDLDNDPSEVGGYSAATPAYGHGTHVAGLVATAAPDARIMPVRVLDPAGSGNIWVLAESILYAFDPDGDPTTPDGADIINLSLSTLHRTDLLDEIMADVTCYGVEEDDDDDGAEEVEPPPTATSVPPPPPPLPTATPVPPPPPVPTATPIPPPPPPVPDDDDDFDEDDVEDDGVEDDFDDDDFEDDLDDDDDDDSGSISGLTTSRVSSTNAGYSLTRLSGAQTFQVPADTANCTGGKVVVAAAGNSGTDTPEYPAAEDVPGVLSVGASGREGQLLESSNFGAWVDVTAPGEDIISAMPEGQYASWSGTSMASALAAGHAVLIRAVFPDMSAEELIDRVVSTSAAIPGPVPWRIDAAAAVTAPR